MRFRILFAAFLLAATLLAAPAFAWRQTARYDVVNHPIPMSAQSLPLGEITRNIMIAGAKRNWRFETMGPGQLKAIQIKGPHEADVKISYNSKAYSIGLLATKNLDQEGDNIHPTYNHWVGNLETDIESQLDIAGQQRK